MAKTINILSFDLGAESGRAVIGKFDGKRIELEEKHRFVNLPVEVAGSLHWNALGLFSELKKGLAKIAQEGIEVASFGVDTWGVDYGLLDRDGKLLGNPFAYRDSRTDDAMEEVFSIVPRKELFENTGQQFMQINTLFQLFVEAKEKAPRLQCADRLLFMPDLLNYWFTGRKVNEFTIASTSQCYNMKKHSWANNVLEKLGIPTHIFQDVVPAGSEIGTLLPALAKELGISKEIKTIVPGCHDTASAVAAVPVSARESNHFAYISSGTWSLMGIETKDPVMNEQTLKYNFTNEGGVFDTVRLLKNIMGLWLIQECRRAWAKQGEEFSYNEISAMASEARPFSVLLDPDDSSFFAPGDMPARIVGFCKKTGQNPPDSKGAILRAGLESLALRYRWVIEKLEELSGRSLKVIHIVGGGTQNRLLNQLAANATGRPVVAGPIEATAIGSVLMQLLAQGKISSLNEGRAIVRESFPVETFEPEKDAAWDEAYGRFLGLIGG